MHFDAHCHLDAVRNTESILKKCEKNGFKGICTASTSLESMKKNIALAKKNKLVFLSLGIHPSDTIMLNKTGLTKAFLFLKKNVGQANAIGEIGLDFKHAVTEKQRSRQLKAFEKQIEIAEKHCLPVVVHGRRAYNECINILSKKFNGKILFHWFMAGKNALKQASRQKAFFSFGPNVVLNKATEKVVKLVPEKKVLCETDAPVPFNGKKSTPLDIIKTEKGLSKILGKSIKTSQKGMEKCFKSLFKP